MRLSRLVAPSLVVLVLGMVASGVLAPPMAEGLPRTPLATLILVPLLRFAMFATGSVAFAAAILGGPVAGRRDVLHLGARASVWYAASSAVLGIATLADVLAREWWDALDGRMLRSFFTQLDEGRYFVTQVLLGLVAMWVLSRASAGLDAVFAAVTLAVAVSLPAFSGHSAAAVSHWLASALMVVHLLALHAWVGGVLVLLLQPDPAAIVGFSRIAGLALPLVVASGLASVVARVNDWTDFLHDRYALVLLAKVALVVVVVLLGRRMRLAVQSSATTRAELVAATRRTLALEGSLMLVTMSVAVILARMANP